jgi:hypothetical protein
MALLVDVCPAEAQQAVASRAYVAANFGINAGTPSLDQQITLLMPVENGELTADYTYGNGRLVDIAGGVRVWRQLRLGVAVARAQYDHPATVSALLPHPFHFDSHREVGGETVDLQRRESSLHFEARWPVYTQGRFEIYAAGGPSWTRVSQDLVESVQASESYPFDEAAFAGVTTARQSASGLGFNAGVDVGWYLSRHVGVGWLARVTRATVEMPAADGTTMSIKAGGFQTGGGLRVRF